MHHVKMLSNFAVTFARLYLVPFIWLQNLQFIISINDILVNTNRMSIQF